MSGLSNRAFASPNFAFLTQYDEVLVRHAALAERYVFDDSNSALIKLRQFGDVSVNRLLDTFGPKMRLPLHAQTT